MDPAVAQKGNFIASPLNDDLAIVQNEDGNPETLSAKHVKYFPPALFAPVKDPPPHNPYSLEQAIVCAVNTRLALVSRRQIAITAMWAHQLLPESASMKQNLSRPPESSDWIGVFDSGLGGLAVVREIAFTLPDERIFYFGDTRHMPYGTRRLDEIREFSLAIAQRLIHLPAKVIVVACNTASAAALASLREAFPEKMFVGMEPAVKPAALNSKTGVIGVLATPATFGGKPFKRLQELFGCGTEIISRPCPGLADAIETYGPSAPEVAALLDTFITPLLPRGIDHLVLGCTHYSLAEAAIRKCAGPGISIVDPSPAVSRRVRQVLSESGLLAKGGAGTLRACVSGDAEMFSRQASILLQQPIQAGHADFSLSAV